MQKPARWKDDPDCGHLVACEFQTHYCTYIRAPRLLTLQRPRTEGLAEALLLPALQAYELWFAVLRRDLTEALARLERGDETFEPAKLLRRGARIIQLLGRQTDVVQAGLDADMDLPLRPRTRGEWSPQLSALKRLARALGGQLRARPGLPSAQAAAGREFLDLFNAWRPRFKGLLDEAFRPAAAGPAYAEYVALNELLSLQDGVKADWTPVGAAPRALAASDVSPDELMFIVVHQAFELWFKAILSEVDAALRELLAEPPQVAPAIRGLRRAVAIQQLLVDQIHIPATMLPQDFFRFRSQTRVVSGVTEERGLSPSSGTESYQFREIEIAAGLKGDEAHAEFLGGSPRLPVRFLTPAQERRLAQPSLPEAFRDLLRRRGIADARDLFRPADAPNPHADLAELADALVAFDEFFWLWRVHHATMVQTMIGERSGTGFLGPEYLRETAGFGAQGAGRIFGASQTRPRFFEFLWRARTGLGPA